MIGKLMLTSLAAPLAVVFTLTFPVTVTISPFRVHIASEMVVEPTFATPAITGV